ncbi:hypothetical protein [Cohnella faecalis]|uniref:hypothetical protein n=1 Tax=Cohnella faecalis TaxID=2315694 RepID=UPI001F3F824D|nr:hypothetical protein [Cohnella faecalis]
MNVDEPFDCLPEEGTDRTRVMPGDLLHYAEAWDAQALEAFRHYDKVDQPLAHLIRPEFHEKVNIAARNHLLVDSIRAIYFDRSSMTAAK